MSSPSTNHSPVMCEEFILEMLDASAFHHGCYIPAKCAAEQIIGRRLNAHEKMHLSGGLRMYHGARLYSKLPCSEAPPSLLWTYDRTGMHRKTPGTINDKWALETLDSWVDQGAAGLSAGEGRILYLRTCRRLLKVGI